MHITPKLQFILLNSLGQQIPVPEGIRLNETNLVDYLHINVDRDYTIEVSFAPETMGAIKSKQYYENKEKARNQLIKKVFNKLDLGL